MWHRKEEPAPMTPQVDEASPARRDELMKLYGSIAWMAAAYNCYSILSSGGLDTRLMGALTRVGAAHLVPFAMTWSTLAS
jgi:hypothetical protein